MSMIISRSLIPAQIPLYLGRFTTVFRKSILADLCLLPLNLKMWQRGWMDYRNPHPSLNAIETLILGSNPEEREALMSILENVLAYRLQGEAALRQENDKLRFLLSEVCEYIGVKPTFDRPIAEQRKSLLDGISSHTRRVSSYLSRDPKLARILKNLDSSGQALIQEYLGRNHGGS